MSAATKAVFLSYAREDLAAARRLCEALREAGIEVWFDANELRGGDAWDASIKRQIRECALFVPVISAQTQAREEGYFRREWKLAVERTHDMAESVPFLVPVAIDDTPQAGVLVPDQFLRAHWARLPRGLPTPQFVEEVKRQLERSRRGGSTAPVSGTGVPPVNRSRGEDAHVPQSPAKRGLLFAATLVLLASMAVGGWWFARKPAASAAPPAVSAKSIAVLPFDNRSEDTENAFFAEGIHEDILMNLANVTDLRVIARPSVMEYRSTTKKIPQIARELGVAYILLGSVSRAGDRVRVRCQLVDGRTGENVLAPEPYDRPLLDIFAIQSELAKSIVAKLQATLYPREKTALERVPTTNLTAYDLYLKAMEVANRPVSPRTRFEQRLPLLQSAVQLDSSFAAAWLALGETHLGAFSFERTEARRGSAKQALDRAAELAPENVKTIAALANYHLDTGDTARATEQGARLLRVAPNHSSTLWFAARQARMQGRLKEAVEYYRRALLLDPRNILLIDALRTMLINCRRYEEAERLIRETADVVGESETVLHRYWRASVSFRARGETGAVEAVLAAISPEERRSYPPAIMALGGWAFIRGDADGLLALWQESGPNWRLPNGMNLVAVGLAFLAKGETEKARQILEKNRDQLLTEQPNQLDRLFNLALTQALLGDKNAAAAARRSMLDPGRPTLGRDELILSVWLEEKDKALDELARHLATGDGGTFFSCNVHEIRGSLYFLPLRGDPRFEAILADPKNNVPLF